MRVVGIERIHAFLTKHPECRAQALSLVQELRTTDFASPQALAETYPSAKVLDGRNVVFKIRGNKYRLVVTIAYASSLVVVEAMETHAEYDRRKIR